MSNLKTSDLIRTTRQLAQGNARNPVNTLAVDYSALSDVIELTYPITGIQPGMVLEIGWVLYNVVDSDHTASTITVLPEIDGTDVDHDAGTRVNLRPRFPVRRIIEEMNADLMDLSGQGIYKLRSVQAVDGVIPLPVDAVVILDVWNDDPSSIRLPGNEYRIADSPTGPVLMGESNIDFAVFGCTLGEFPYDSDVDVDTVGLVSTAEDLPSFGAALRLLIGSEAQRNLTDTQGDTRRSDEVPPGAITGALRNLAAVRQQRIVTEAQRFQQRYGIKKYRAI
jgi:hypothetical protein